MSHGAKESALLC